MHAEARGFAESAHLAVHPSTDLEDQDPAWGEGLGRLGHEPEVHGEAIPRRRHQCQARVMVPDLGIEARDLRRIHVGGIARDEVEAPSERREEVAEVEADPRPEPRGVAAGHLEGRRGNIHGVHFGVGAFQGQGDCDAPTAGADVDDAGSPPRLQLVEAGLDQGFGLRARDQHVRCHLELVSPEGLGSGEVLERAAPGPLVDQGVEAGLVPGIQEAFRIGQHPGAVPAQDVAQQQLGIEVGVGDAGGGQLGRAEAEGLGDRQTGSGTLSFSAW
jgi:hypothetical protein